MPVVQSLGAMEALSVEWRPYAPYGAVRMYDTYSYDYATLYRTQPNVRTCVDFLARNIAQLGLHVFRRVSDTDRQRLTDHPLAVLLGRPMPAEYKVTRYRLIESLVADMGIYFNAYLLKIRPTGEAPMGLLRIPPGYVTVRGTLWPQEYEINYGGQPRRIAPNEMLHFRGHNPDSATVGLSPLETLRRVLAEEHSMGAYRQGFWQNAARMHGIIERPATSIDWSPDARARFKAEFEALYAGEANSGKTAILEEGMTWKPGTFNAQESEYLAGRKLTREECARAYHIPLPMVGILDNATFSNIREQHKNLYQDSLGPWLAMMEQDIELQLLPDFDDSTGIYVEFNIAEKLQGCLPAGSLVSTERGPVPIEQVPVGTRVWSAENGHLVLRPVVRAWCTGIEPTYMVRTQNRTVTATGNHPVMVQRSTTDGLRDEWVPVDQLARGDVLTALHELPDLGSDRCPTRKVTEGFAEFVGLYLGDGSMEYVDGRERSPLRPNGTNLPRRPSAVSIAHSPEATYMDHYRQVMLEEFVCMGPCRSGEPRIPVTPQIRPNATRFSSRAACAEMLELGLGGDARTKTVPDWVFGLSHNLRAAVVRGFLDSDGTVNKHGYMTFTSCNRRLLEGIRHLCLSLRVSASNLTFYRGTSTLPTGALAPVEQWQFGCYRGPMNAAVIGSNDSRYRAHWDAMVAKTARRQVPDGFPSGSTVAGCSGASVVSITRNPDPVKVYDLTVDGSHNFIADGVIVHNSFEEQTTALQASVGRPWMTADEARARANLPSMGGDAAELATPLNVLMGGQASPQDSAPDGAVALRGASGQALPAPGAKARRGRIDPTQPRLRARHEEQWRRVIVRTFERQRGAVMGHMKGLKADINSLWDAERWNRELYADIRPMSDATAKVWARYLAQLLKFELDEERMDAWLDENSRIAAERINGATQKDIGAALDGEDPITALGEMFALAIAARATEIASTRVTMCSNFGAHEGARQGGLRSKTWQVNSDNPRPEHAAMDGETVGIGELFSNGARFPGDPILGADGNANCQCSCVFGTE